MLAAVRMARELYESRALVGLVGEETLPGGACQTDEALDAFLLKASVVAAHPVATRAMGTGNDAVVDAQLWAHGLKGLRVVDASVIPTIPGAETYATTVMIAEKAADLTRLAA